jgi:asparagine synthase (glutamine-hydrolysing)
VWERLRVYRLGCGGVVADLLTAASPVRLARVLTPVCRGAPRRFRCRKVGDKLHKLGEVLPLPDTDVVYSHGLISHWKDPARVVIDGVEPQTLGTDKSRWPVIRDYTERMRWLDLRRTCPMTFSQRLIGRRWQ